MEESNNGSEALIAVLDKAYGENIMLHCKPLVWFVDIYHKGQTMQKLNCINSRIHM